MIFRKRKKKQRTNRNHVERPNYTLQRKYPIPEDDTRHYIELGGIYYQSMSQSKESVKIYKDGSR